MAPLENISVDKLGKRKKLTNTEVCLQPEFFRRVRLSQGELRFLKRASCCFFSVRKKGEND
ncbi:unnamed protein product [Sphenostylis stenocarpa]|uniref:Uncharacterized protein n=1 Tax=Sphenostylis stenocarpa TaxID=92480 RepID=A0AA86SLQ0_9FABA|nr:unnamed protein product [Sphenostylis stenocarpa]